MYCVCSFCVIVFIIINPFWDLFFFSTLSRCTHYVFCSYFFQQPVHPTTGILAVFVALNYCDVVHVAGFGYPKTNSPRHPIHYYGFDTMRSMKVGSAGRLQRPPPACSLCFWHTVFISVAELLPRPRSWSPSLKATGELWSYFVPAPTFMMHALCQLDSHDANWWNLNSVRVIPFKLDGKVPSAVGHVGGAFSRHVAAMRVTSRGPKDASYCWKTCRDDLTTHLQCVGNPGNTAHHSA